MCPGSVKVTQVTDTSDDAKSKTSLLNLQQGNPTMYESYWDKLTDKLTMTIPAAKNLSYYSCMNNLCWFMEPELGEAIKRLHWVTGNAVTEDKFIVVGTGSTQLIHAAFYALSVPSANLDRTVSIVTAVPYYSGYPEIANLLHSPLYKWEGDANVFKKEGPYIEVVCTPNNPDGSIQVPAVPNHESRQGMLVHDFAYLWPQYTPIAAPADHDIMLFTLSKSTGHAGSRIGWALVKDKSVAQRMVNFIVISSIGVPKEAQLRAAGIMEAIADRCGQEDDFFEYCQLILKDRWRRLREVVDQGNIFTVKDYESGYCSYFKDTIKPNPAYAWVSSEHISDLSKFLQGLKILVRGGAAFGAEPKYARVSMLAKDEEFNQFLDRLAAVKETDLPGPDDQA